jgi:hypothetical protein
LVKEGPVSNVEASHERWTADENIAWTKLSLLSSGIIISDKFRDWFSTTEGFVRRRNFYNSPGATSDGFAAPQELRLLASRSVTVAVNQYGPSPWQLSITPGGEPVLHCDQLDLQQPVEMLPDLAAIRDDDKLAHMCNLYGGSALSFFSPRACYFFADGNECRFCSLAGTADENAEYAARLSATQVYESVARVVAIPDDRALLTQIMIVGGNERNLDRGFTHQIDLVRAASAALAADGLTDEVSVHLIVMPPRNLTLLDALSDIPNLHVGFNLEVWDPGRFRSIAPGKTADYGQENILSALHRLVEVLGAYRAHSILIAGLEPSWSTLKGARTLAEAGISPIINVYHSDRHSVLGMSVRPRYSELAEVASGLQTLHDQFPIQPYWKGCGRNAIDHEAAEGMFAGMVPSLDAYG